MDWLNDPATREIALKVIIAFITALLAALGYDREQWKKDADTGHELIRSLQEHNATLIDENTRLQRDIQARTELPR